MIWQNTSFNSKKSICYQCHQNQKIKFTESSNFVKSAKICETLCCEKNYPKYPRKLSLREQFEESAWSAIFRFLKGTVDQIVKSLILSHARNLLEFENRPYHIMELNPLGIQSFKSTFCMRK